MRFAAIASLIIVLLPVALLAEGSMVPTPGYLAVTNDLAGSTGECVGGRNLTYNVKQVDTAFAISTSPGAGCSLGVALEQIGGASMGRVGGVAIVSVYRPYDEVDPVVAGAAFRWDPLQPCPVYVSSYGSMAAVHEQRTSYENGICIRTTYIKSGPFYPYEGDPYYYYWVHHTLSASANGETRCSEVSERPGESSTCEWTTPVTYETPSTATSSSTLGTVEAGATQVFGIHP